MKISFVGKLWFKWRILLNREKHAENGNSCPDFMAHNDNCGYSKGAWNMRQIWIRNQHNKNTTGNSSELREWLSGDNNPWPKASDYFLNKKLKRIRDPYYDPLYSPKRKKRVYT